MAANLEIQQLSLNLDEKNAAIRQLEEKVKQVEGELRMCGLTKDQLAAELERLQQEQERLNSALADEKQHCQTVQQRKELVDKKLGQTEAVVDTLKVELESLHMTNDELAQEARKEILGLKDEMAQMKAAADAEIRKLQEQLMNLQADRDQMESAYQFAKDELAVIRATLAEMEEGQQRTQYITEDAGNPVLVNRMQSEWNRVDGQGGPVGQEDDMSPRRQAFQRDFRRAHAGATPDQRYNMDPGKQRQGALGHFPWK